MPEKLHIDYIKKFLEDKNEGVQLLTQEYVDQNHLLQLKCSCGKVFERKWINLHSQTYTVCKDCAVIKRGKSQRVDFETVEKLFAENGYTLLSKEYLNNGTRLLCKDAEGYIGRIFYAKLKSGSHIEKFSAATGKEFLIHNLNVWAQLNEINTSVIGFADSQKWSRIGIKCKCSCGNVFETSARSFQSTKTCCDDCTKRKSRYEKMAEKWLKKNECVYISQYRFNECKNVLPLPFDFYLPDYNLLIEVDGEGHYFPSYFNHCSKEKAVLGFQRTKTNDEIKTKFCKSFNIKLLRIPYWEFDNGNYKNILLNAVKD